MITENERLSIIQWVFETQNEDANSKINAIKNERVVLTAAQQKVLRNCLKRYAYGTIQFSSWENVKARIAF